jgi:DNA-directed RNA polymerase I and III subunit RPAC1
MGIASPKTRLVTRICSKKGPCFLELEVELDLCFFSSLAMVDPSRLVEILPERVGSTSSPHFPHHNANSTDHSWSLDHFRNSLQTTITRLSPDRVEFDLVGLDASIANALRRILMAEVATVAIESVYVWNNTSIVVDEVLSHRLGLVPLKIDPERLAFRGRE